MKEHFTIDESALDKEWLRQPELAYKYGRRAAESRKDLTDAKNNLEAVEAELAAAIRKDSEAYGLKKITDASVRSVLIAQTRYKNCVKTLTDAQFAHDVAVAAVSAIDHKKKALENLVDLHGMDYFSAPRHKNASSEKAEEEITKKAARHPVGRRKE